MPGATSGWPMAPRRIESNLRSSSIAMSGRVSPVLMYLSPPKSNSVRSTLKPNLSAAVLRTFTASTVTSGPVPSPGITAILYVFISCFSFRYGLGLFFLFKIKLTFFLCGSKVRRLL